LNTFYQDSDADSYGNINASTGSCDESVTGYVTNTWDCDDTDDTVYSGATELCDGQDNDCDTIIPSNETDDDSDGYVECTIDAGGWDGTGAVAG